MITIVSIAKIIQQLTEGQQLSDTPDLNSMLQEVNQASGQVNQWLLRRKPERR